MALAVFSIFTTLAAPTGRFPDQINFERTLVDTKLLILSGSLTFLMLPGVFSAGGAFPERTVTWQGLGLWLKAVNRARVTLVDLAGFGVGIVFRGLQLVVILPDSAGPIAAVVRGRLCPRSGAPINVRG